MRTSDEIKDMVWKLLCTPEPQALDSFEVFSEWLDGKPRKVKKWVVTYHLKNDKTRHIHDELYNSESDARFEWHEDAYDVNNGHSVDPQFHQIEIEED